MAKRYRIYRNLNNGMLSIKDNSLGLVIGHCYGIMLKECKFVVLPSGKKRAIKRGVRNVHAFVEGEICRVKDFQQFKGRSLEQADGYGDVSIDDLYGGERISYNPFDTKGFYFKDNGKEIWESEYALMRVDENGVDFRAG